MDRVYRIDENVSYQFDLKSKCGFIVGTRKEIYVITKYTPEQYNACTFSHINKVNCLYENKADRHLICEHHKKGLKSLFGNWNMSGNLVRRYSIPYWVHQGYKFTGGTHVSFLHPEVRNVIRQMYKFVHDMHVKGYSLTPFELEHLRIQGDNVVTFSGIGFIPQVDADARKTNFESVEKVIRKFINEKAVPTLDELFSIRKSLAYDQLEDGYLLTQHLSIIPPKNVIYFIRMCGRELPNNQSDLFYFEAVQGMRNCSNWNSRFINDRTLNLVQSCYSHEKAKPYFLEESGMCLEKFSLLQFTRNMAVHLGENLTGKQQLDDIKREAIIMNLFGLELSDIQYNMHRSDSSDIPQKFQMEA